MIILKWWKRLIFTVISLVLGFCSLDYLYYAYKRLTYVSKGTAEGIGKDSLSWLIGIGMFFLWFFIVGLYFFIVRHFSMKVSIIEEDVATGKQHVRHKWGDIILQAACILTGLILRWAYVLYILIPKL